MLTKGQLIRLTKSGSVAPPPSPQLAISGNPAVAVLAGTTYSFTPIVTNGVPPYTFSLYNGSLPAWLSLNSSTGALTSSSVGNTNANNIGIRVTDAAMNTADLPIFTIEVEVPPVSVSVDWGAKTRRGHGGVDLSRYYGPGSYQITSGNVGSIWAIDSNGHIVLTGTYGNAPPALANSYNLVVSKDGVEAGTITFNVVPHTYHIRPLSIDTTNSNQLRNVLQLGAEVNFGDKIIFRDGSIYNPSMLDMRVRKPAQFTQRTGGPEAPTASAVPKTVPASEVYARAVEDCEHPGWVTVTSETPYGATIRLVTIEGNTVAPQYIRFTQLTLERFNTVYQDGGAVVAVLCQAPSGTLAYSWLSFYDNKIQSRVEPGEYYNNGIAHGNLFNGSPANRSNIASGLRFASATNGVSDIYVVNNSFEDVFDGAIGTGTRYWFVGNNLKNVWNDGTKGRPTASIFAWNVFYNKLYGDGDLHGDYFQEQWGGLAAGTYEGNRYICNIMRRGTGIRSNTSGGQGVFIADAPTGVEITGIEVLGNLYIDGFVNGINITRGKDPVVRWNTVIQDQHPNVTANNPTIRLIACQGGDINYNAIHSSTTTGTAVLLIQNQISAPNSNSNNRGILPADYASHFADPIYGDDTLENYIAGWSLKASGPLDGATKTGALGTGYVDWINKTVSFPSI